MLDSGVVHVVSVLGCMVGLPKAARKEPHVLRLDVSASAS
eukprot:SAG11_NODE_34809_length_270_cov_0.596491_1_plen_39_part_10